MARSAAPIVTSPIKYGLRRPSVLVVDDEPLILALLKAALEHDGIATAVANNARQACELFETHHSSIQILVSDVIMPETNGIQLAERLLEEKPELKVIFVS